MDDLVLFTAFTAMIFVALGFGFMLGSMGFIFDIMKKEKEEVTYLAKKMSSKL